MAWTTDGGLIATVRMVRADEAGDTEQYVSLARFEADGARRWGLESRDRTLGVVGATAGGGAVVAAKPAGNDGGPDGPGGLTGTTPMGI